MSDPEIQPAYPLRWPEGRPRSREHQFALFRDNGSRMTLTTARRRLVREVEAMTKRGHNWRVTNMVLSLNIRFTASGARDQNVSRRDPADPGVAFYFDLDRRPHVLACDRWDTVADNIAAIAAHVDALRGQERWGVADLSQAFAGHLALPSSSSLAARPWWSVLEVSASASIDEIDRAYRSKAKAAHPDAGSGREAWDDLVAAYDQAKKERMP